MKRKTTLRGKPLWAWRAGKTMLRVAAAGTTFETITTLLYATLIAIGVWAAKHGG